MAPTEAQVAPSQQNVDCRSWSITLTSFAFILLQSACATFVAISGMRLVIGMGALAVATTGLKFMASIHGNAIRLPMEIAAIAGSVVNLYAIRRVRALRARPASQWRMTQPTQKQKRSEFVQIALAVLTLLLVVVEWVIHIHLHGMI